MKLPLTKYLDNKGFAFIYYESPDDAAYVKEKLDHTVLLANKIRVTKTVNADSLSKMMFKLKAEGLTKEQIAGIKEKYFNEKNLEAEVSKIIAPLLNNSVEVNKIIISRHKENKQPLNYARGFFYISNLKEASRIAKLATNQAVDNKPKKEDYEVVLSFIVDKLNSDLEFSKYVKAEIYEYSNKNRSNVLHVKNINAKHDEDPAKVAKELQDFVQEQRKQAKILACFVAMFGKSGAWANISFDTFEETQAAYEFFKANRVNFRGKPIYATLKNVKDLRTVVISTVQKDAKEVEINKFLNKLAERSQRVDANDESKGRKYDFATLNILEKKTFYHVSANQPAVALLEGQ